MTVLAARFRNARFPVGAARDLLGITRALYRAEQAGAGNPLALEDLKQIGEKLKTAIDLATRADPGTIGHSAAWSHADDAMTKLGALIGDEMNLAPVFAATLAHVQAESTKTPTWAPTEREAKRIARKRRG